MTPDSLRTEDEVVLVDEQDRAIGAMGKLQAHLEGKLHRAFSIFLFDASGRLLLQRRADTKYHSAGLWTNTCCSHPRPGESVDQAALRRLQEEMGISTALTEQFSFTYRAELENGLIEHELDHVLFGAWSGPPDPDPAEVSEWRYADADDLEEEMRLRPERYTFWLRACWPRVRQLIRAEPT
ncbi:MAG: isopentenyl-diphosphate Delta-isomerase [Flavobacteriales bacterium]|nr:isopentenyl-diphosphate Delta-isomerase [Flavobacteriales bacterium]